MCVQAGSSPMGQARVPVTSKHRKYSELLARYYVLKRQHVLAAQILVRLAEKRSTEAGDTPTLDQRFVLYLHTTFWITKTTL